MKQLDSQTSEALAREIENFSLQAARYKNKEIPEEKFKRYRLQNGIYGQRQAGLQMVRVKIPAGQLDADQMRCLADVSEQHATKMGHVTTRQDIQLYYVDLDNVPSIMTALSEVGLSTREACGNTVRNVTACQKAGICPTELFDVSAISEKVAYFLLWNPINQDLPRKFKISFSGCQTECGLAAIHDLGFVATQREVDGKSELGFKVFVAGGLGSHPKLAQVYSDFISVDDVLPLCEAALTLFDRHGNRRNKSKARMKFVLENWGLEKFCTTLDQLLAEVKASDKAFVDLPQPSLKAPSPVAEAFVPEEASSAAFKRWCKSNLVPQSKGGFAVQVKLPLGDITSEQMRKIATLTEDFATQGLRTTHQQNLMLHHTNAEQVPALYAALESIGLSGDGAEKIVDVIACPGADTCQLALTNSMGVGGAISKAFDDDLDQYDDLEGLRIRISGCPNSCGHHHIAGIGLHGVAKKVNGTLVPHYQLHLGGQVNADDSKIGKSKIKLPAKNIPSAVLSLVKLYRDQQAEDESFNAFVERFGREAIGEHLSEFETLPPQENSILPYRDYKEDKKVFSLDEIGPGECSGTVIDMIEYGLRRAGENIEKAASGLAQEAPEVTVQLIQDAILFDCRSLLYTYGIETKHDDQILKEFQHKLVEQGILTEGFEVFTSELGKWADFGADEKTLQKTVESAKAFVEECQEAYDRMDASMKFRKTEKE